MKTKTKKSKLSRYFTLVLVASIVVVVYEVFFDKDGIFDLNSRSAMFGSSITKSNDGMEEGKHSKEFWTSGRFKL